MQNNKHDFRNINLWRSGIKVLDIPQTDKVLTEKNFVCVLHINSNDIIKYDEFKVAVVGKSERITPILNTGAAVSTICPGLP